MVFLDRIKNKFHRTFIRKSLSQVPKEKERTLINQLRQEIRDIEIINTNNSEMWYKFQHELKTKILENDPRKFLEWDIIKSTMNYTAKKIEFDTIRNSGYWRLFIPAILETKVGNPEPYYYYPKSSGNLIHHAYSFYQLQKLTDIELKKDINSIFEFGGGYGSFCRFCYQFGYNGIYTIYDFRVLNILQKYFLKSVPIKQVPICQNYEEKPAIILMNDENNKQFQNKALKQIDLFIALWSISETPISFRDTILKIINFPKFILIAYQNKYLEIDNVLYFNQLKEKHSRYQWHDFPIKHIKDNRYLIGIRD